MTPVRKPKSTERRETYVVCLEGGKEFLYDLEAMRVGNVIVARDRSCTRPIPTA
jgi:hypothetical protein